MIHAPLIKGQRAFIIHGYLSFPGEAWLPWIKVQLEARGYTVALPAMPNPEHPDPKTWTDLLQALVGEPDEETTLIGHSIGCQVVLRYLERLGQEGKKVKKAVLVAGNYPGPSLAARFDPLNEEDQILLPWLTVALDGDAIRRAARSCTVILSDNDSYIPFETTKAAFEAEINAEVILDAGKGHFNEDEGLLALPTALAAVLA